MAAVVLERAPVALIATDAHGRIGYWNLGAERLFGWPRDEARGRRLAELAAPGDGEAMRAVFGAERGWEGYLAVRRKDGSEITVASRSAGIFAEGGTRVGLVIASFPSTLGWDDDGGDTRRQIGWRISRARREAGLTQGELAERLGVTRRSVQGYESGAVVPYRRLRRLAEVAGRDVAWLLEGEGSGERDPLIEDLRAIVRDELLRLFGDVRFRQETAE